MNISISEHALKMMAKRGISECEVKVGISLDVSVLEDFKVKALKVGIPYQTLINSVLKRYVESKLDIDAA